MGYSSVLVFNGRREPDPPCQSVRDASTILLSSRQIPTTILPTPGGSPSATNDIPDTVIVSPRSHSAYQDRPLEAQAH